MTKQMEYIVWVDVRSEEKWMGYDGIVLYLAKITTLGFFISENSKVLCVAQSVEKATGHYSDIIFIPKNCIVSRQVIKKRKKK